MSLQSVITTTVVVFSLLELLPINANPQINTPPKAAFLQGTYGEFSSASKKDPYTAYLETAPRNCWADTPDATKGADCYKYTKQYFKLSPEDRKKADANIKHQNALLKGVKQELQKTGNVAR